MHRSKILVRTLFVIILLAGLIAGIFLSSLASVHAAPQQLGQQVLLLVKFMEAVAIQAPYTRTIL